MFVKFSVLLLFCAASQAAVPAANPCDSIRSDQNFAPNPRGCSWYFYCGEEDRSDPIEGKCPYNLQLNVQEQGCTYADSLDPQCTFDEEIMNNTFFDCPNNNDFRIIPHPLSCSQYTMCWRRKWADYDCPPDAPHFSMFDRQCTTEFLADCNVQKRFCSTGDLEEFRANPRTCDNYLLCTECENEFTIHKWQCPAGLKYKMADNFCVDEAQVTCHVDEHPTFVPPPEPMTMDCSLPIAEHSMWQPHPTDCQYYFICPSSTSASILERCTDDRKFDINELRCEPIATAQCLAGTSRSLSENNNEFMISSGSAKKIAHVVPKILI